MESNQNLIRANKNLPTMPQKLMALTQAGKAGLPLGRCQEDAMPP